MEQITVDASNQSLGRLASHVAELLRGKDKPDFAPNKLPNRKVVVENIDKIRLTGGKEQSKVYRRHSGYIGHLKVYSMQQIGLRKVFMLAVSRMLPKNRLQKRMLTRIEVK